MILIDANNLIHKIPHLKNNFDSGKDSVRISLIETVSSRISSISLTETATFVFDGHGISKKTNVIFSGNKSADEIIKNYISGFDNHKKLIVVSSDNEVMNFARICGAKAIKSEDFWKQISKSKSETEGKNINQNYLYNKSEKPERLSKKEIDEFRKYFS